MIVSLFLLPKTFRWCKRKQRDEHHHIITWQDVTNIKRKIGIVENLSEGKALGLWLENMKEDPIFILDFKLQNTEHPNLKYDNFI